ncbi:hypothetical protein DRN63_04950 [Nanoarchaeota archaeon]|nr:MAG: hypothetical protein DRN63_04950 [Nanoarchaeota archaeon]
MVRLLPKGVKREELLLAVLRMFNRLGREEVSLVELLEAVKNLQRSYKQLRYDFWDRFIYSPKLANDLSKLEPFYVKRIVYRHDAYLPKTYFALTILGQGRGEVIVNKLDDELKNKLKESVIQAVKSYDETWKLWRRPSY